MFVGFGGQDVHLEMPSSCLRLVPLTMWRQRPVCHLSVFWNVLDLFGLSNGLQRSKHVEAVQVLKGKYDERVDYWSFGVILYAMLSESQ